MLFVQFLLAACAAVVALLAAWRFFTVRGTGTFVTLRPAGMSGLRGWHHGEIRYEGDTMSYFKILSLRPTANQSFKRQNINLVEVRDLHSNEVDLISADSRVAVFKVTGPGSSGGTYEMVLTPPALLAFSTWVEAAPDIRQVRPDLRALRRRLADARSRRSAR